ncbi:GNAT family N-acetyltransferase [Cytobacillus gottheilii]|uniref:GNAT family N-acetyltransferase n=1 Tax=Cytobacillus gottheilii TaxID=859144 RepID=A0ABX8F691_9BACI|nr:GNAT family N-acetyltransferase [Cytobacillus gottheilii]QVY59958.1 GNAT family N-acetyltransferase [Cytobacillus gottheilii]
MDNTIHYFSDFYINANGKTAAAVIRNYKDQDFDDLIQIQAECFPPPFPSDLWWSEEQLKSHIHHFPEGALCIEVDGELAGSLTGLMINFDPDHPYHTWKEVTDHGYIKSHDPNGDTLYIVDISVKPKFRKLGLGKMLMEAMYHIVIQLNLKRLLGGGRMPGYHLLAEKLTPDEYIAEVVRGNYKDPVISFLLRCGRKPIAVCENYLEDNESLNYGVLMEWKNPFK